MNIRHLAANRSIERWCASVGLEPELSSRFASVWRFNDYSRGDILFYQGNTPMALFFLCSGRIKLVRSDRAGRRQIIRIIHAPDFAGERALITSESYAASAEVMDAACISVMDAASFSYFWNKRPEFVRAMARQLAFKLGQADTLAVDFALHTIRERLSKLIVLQAESLAKPETSFLLTPSRRELAELLGSSPEVVSRALRDLSRRNLIALEGQRVRVVDTARLRAASGLPGRRLDFYQVRSTPASSRLHTITAINRMSLALGKRGKHD